MANYATRRSLSPHDARCMIEGCESKVYAKGWCAQHYNVQYRKRADNPIADYHHGVVRGIPKGWGSLR